ncbi:mitochondrial metal transporter [Coemansia biformis]|uniref:Mitochondrial metal transporter n=1 Tax=Coemansia biformis TaxID=1286918 RepID=A0A9W8CYR4_9FUNG|nr:mitochondrial metal transporter [Coemansia biformis]
MSAPYGGYLGRALLARARCGASGQLVQRAHPRASYSTGGCEAAGRRWSARERGVLRDAASSFSSFSHARRKERDGESHTHGLASANPHSHSHSHGLFGSHSHGCGGETADKIDLIEHSRAGSRITLVGIGANVGMGVAKGAAGLIFHSSALVADAAHSLSDILGDVVTLYTFRKSRRPPDAVRPYGYGRYEALGTLVVSVFLVAAGVGIGSHALEQAAHLLPDVFGAAGGSAAHEALESARNIAGAAAASGSGGAGEAVSGLSSGLSSLLHIGHSHGVHAAADGTVDPRAIWFAVGSIVVNETLFRATMRVGERTKSNVLIANAWHHRSDALTSLVAVGAIGGAIVGFPILDAVGGLVVSAMLAKSGASMMVDAAREVTDAPPPPSVTSEVTRAVDKAVVRVPAVRGYSGIRCRKSGPFVHVQLCLAFAPTETAARMADAVAQVRDAVHDSAGFVQRIDIEVVAAAADASTAPPALARMAQAPPGVGSEQGK